MRGVIVNWSTEVPQMFISTARSLNRVGEERTYSFCLELLRSGICLPGSTLVMWGHWPWWPLGLALCDYVYGLFIVVIELWDPCSDPLALSLERVLTWLTNLCLYLVWSYITQKRIPMHHLSNTLMTRWNPNKSPYGRLWSACAWPCSRSGRLCCSFQT